MEVPKILLSARAYAWRVKLGQKPACTIYYHGKHRKLLEKYANSSSLQFYAGVDFWMFKDSDLLPTIIALESMSSKDDPKFSSLSKIFSTPKEYHTFMGLLFGYSKKSVVRFLRSVEKNPHLYDHSEWQNQMIVPK